MQSIIRIVIVSLVLWGCSTPVEKQPLAVSPLPVPAGQKIQVDSLLILVDTSASIKRDTLYPEEKALVQSFTGTLPDGDYVAGQIVFGGRARQVSAPRSFDRNQMRRVAASIEFLDTSTDLHVVLDEAEKLYSGQEGDLAIVFFSDGKPTRLNGARPGEEQAIESATILAAARSGKTCIYTVQISSEEDGREFLQRLSRVTECGGYRDGAALQDVASFHVLQRDIFLSGELPAVGAASNGDRDGDGVPDARDRCPQTPRGIEVTQDGCWVAEPIGFELEQSELGGNEEAELERLAERLKANPQVRVRVDGYTDTTGPAGYNQTLSEQRAEAAGTYLEAQGIDAGRIEIQGRGPDAPRVSNDTLEGRRENRRVEITQIP